MKNEAIINTKDGKSAKDGSIESSPGPIAYLVSIISKVKPKLMNAESSDISMPVSSDNDVLKLIAENPKMNASTFYNLLKSRGLKISVDTPVDNKTPTKQADSGSSFGQVLRADPKKESTFKFISNRFLESVSGDTSGVDGSPKSPVVGFTKFKVVLLKEGIGNFGDAFYYSKDAVTSAVPIFEGAKIYADHPSKLDDQVRPERTVRDILGHFENIHLEESDLGETQLVGEVCILPDDSYRWARSMMEHAVEYSKKYPDKEFIGLSINANGDANPINIDEFMKTELPSGVLIKLNEAKNMGIDEIKVVTKITSCTSCDLVTEAGAGGKVMQLLEGKKNMDETKDQKPPMAEATPAAPAHDDAAQDAELIKSMIKKYMGDNSQADEAECGVVKEAYEACKEMGMNEDEAGETAVKQLKLAKHMAAKKEAATKDADGDDDSDPATKDPAAQKMKQSEEAEEAEEMKKVKEAMIKLRAENAKLKESIVQTEVKEHLEKTLRESKFPRRVTEEFRKAVVSPKSKTEIDSAWKLFERAFRLSSTDGGGMFNDIVITPEKTMTTVGKKGLFEDISK